MMPGRKRVGWGKCGASSMNRFEQRTAIAEAAGGDLFVSIHANSAPRHKTRGIEIY
ncbi:MAG: hypothetical protein F6K65_16050, partial [Moorea sp. SIO3C2]|nr:hypothetical protein [Moorena sp. SIO3C2]